MTELAISGFDAWNEVCPRPSHTPENPTLLTPTSVFLFEDVVSQVRTGIHWAGWQWCDSPRLLAGVLLHVTLPDIASWLFDDSSFDDAKRLPLRAVAEAAAGWNQDDRDFFLEIADELEALESGPEPIEFAVISAICDRVSARFNETPNWNFTLQAYPSTFAAGAAFFEEQAGVVDPDTGEDFTEAQWLDLCARAGSDPAAGGVVTTIFEDAFVH
jgi:hypothetical protein